RQRYGYQNHQRVAEAFELRGQHQEDDRQGQAEGDEQCAALLDVLPRSAGIVEAVAARRLLAGDGGDGVDGLTLADDGHAFDDRRVELLELLELGWPCPVAEADQRTQR